MPETNTAGWTTIPAAVRAAAATAPDTLAVVDGDLRLTYAELDAEVTRFARGVIARGMRPGERAAVWAPNSGRWIIAALGIMAAGGVLVPVNTRFKGEEARHALAKVRAELLVVDDGFLGNAYLAMLRGGVGVALPEPTSETPVPALPSLRTVVTMRASDDPFVLPFDRLTADGERIPAAEVDRRVADLRPDDVADILFTSGTTGFPKGAMVTHRSNLWVDEAWSDMVGLLPGDRYLLINPFFHSFGYRAGILACLVRTATMVPLAVFDVEAALELVQAERITVFPGAPTVYSSILAHPRRGDYDLGSVRLAVTGATVVPVPLLKSMRADLGFRDVITAYGLTETCGTATVCPPDTDQERLSTSCGKAIPGVEVVIADPGGETVPTGEKGEILVRGANLMVGYFEDPGATAKAIDAAGWLHTGDIGWLDADGYLRVTDRLKDMFVVGGFNAYPAEIERLLSEHPDVAEVAVVGTPDDRLGEVGHAYVVAREGRTPTEEELTAFCRDTMANYKVPRHFSFVGELPRTPSGKIQKFRLGASR
ncbi:Acyl-CoA synthetase (AMP-forming)/AMP-acid ligase II [Prauserella marina]|uniref:Acyl-CoA synthetase (AMP-forming)/AMP-acid ligase II n=1 Tax=Prauserella marina TaxID=530584 RepID=A0A1G6RGT7_9PSEU|nr:FadD3 family acyl-CoA ligase [Prauserella marina]PWV77077.1 acyl-CoA synthetase (AMP-forming)/AMP-acid ligase II [Prauserella marina]SDD03859.1 Acyl-CoA synthetase (AMP-forming)/AMP-acid ligase II [Prauserella marina]